MNNKVKEFIKSEFMNRVAVARSLAETKSLRVNDITLERVTENSIEVSGGIALAEILEIKPDISYYSTAGGYLRCEVSFEFEGVRVTSREYVSSDEVPEGAVISNE